MSDLPMSALQTVVGLVGKPHSQQHAPVDAARSDIFLHVQAKRAGKVKGESRTERHVDDIEVRGWGWGAAAGSALGSGAATARRQYKPLVIVKKIDSASTPLLSALATNDEIKEAVLTMRKAGGSAVDYFKMTLNNARVSAVEVNVGADGVPLETVTIAYTKIEVAYVGQTGSGGNAATTTFTDELLPT